MLRHLLATLLAVFALNAFAAVDANQATRADLETVKGIGPGLSGKILEARKSGGFKNWEDMVDRVGGIGPGNAGKLSQGGLTVAGNGFDAAALTAKPAKATRQKDVKADGTETPAVKAGKKEPAKAPKVVN